jgi:hypothetical protein
MLQALMARAKQPAPVHESVSRTQEAAQGPDPPPSAPTTGKGRKLSQATFLGGAAADIGSTLYFQHHPELGLEEANPLVKWAPQGAQVPIGAAMEGAAAVIGHKLLKNHPKILNGLLIAAGLAHGGAAAKNIALIKKKQGEGE